MAKYDDLGATLAPPETNADKYSDLGATPVPTAATTHDYSDLGATPAPTAQDLAQQGESAIYQHAVQNPADVETAFQADKLRRGRPLSEKAMDVARGVAGAVAHPIETVKPVVNFLGGLVEAPLHSLEWWKSPETKQAENTLAAQHGELSVKHAARSIPGATENAPTVETDNGVQVGKLKLPKGDAAKVEALRKKEGGGNERALFNQRVEQMKNELQLARGEPLDTGAIAGIYHLAGQQPSEEVGPAALKAAGVAQSDPGTVERMSAASDPTNLAMAHAGNIPGASYVGGRLTQAAGKLAQVPMNLAERAGSALAHTGPAGRTVAGLTGAGGVASAAHAGLVHPATAAIAAGVAAGAKGLQLIGRAAEAQGAEMATGVPSALTTRAAEAAATGKSAIGANVQRKIGDTLAQGASTAVGMAPLNAMLAQGDPEEFGRSEVGAGVFGGAIGAFHRNRPMLVEAIRPYLQREGTRALTEAANGNDPLAARSLAYISSLPPEAQTRTLEAIGALQGLPTNTPNGPVRAKLYVLNDADYRNVIAQKMGAQQAAMGGGRGFFIGDDGAAYVNGDYHSGLAPSELAHTIGHEFGGHAAVNVMQAAGAKGGALYQGLINSAKEALMPGGKVTPEFYQFVREYNQRFDPTGQTERLSFTNPESIDEFIAEQAGQLMAAKGAGELAIPKNIQDRISDGIGRFMGSMLGIDTRKVGTETHFGRTEVGSLSKAVQDTLGQVVGMKLRGGAEIPEPAKTTATRVAELNQILAKPRPGVGGPLETTRAWIAEQTAARRELASLQEAGTGTPAAGPAPVAPSAPAIISPPEVTTDALKALAVMGIKGPKANALIRMANTQHGSPINDSGQLAAGAFRIHGGGQVKPGEFVPKPQAPIEPVPIPTGDKGTFRDELGATHVVTGPAPGAPRIGDIVATRDGEIRRITAIRGDTVDTARPIDPLNTHGNKVHKLSDIQPLAHDYAEPTATPGAPPEPAKPALSVQPRGDRFIIVDAAGNPINSQTYASERDANQGIRQQGKGKFSLFPNPNEALDVIDTLQDRVPGIYFGGISKEEAESFIGDKYLRDRLATNNPDYAPDEVLRNVQPTPEEPIDHNVNSISELGQRIEEAYRQRKTLAAQQEAEAKRQKAAQKNAPNEPAEPTPPDNISPQPAVATTVSERPAGAPEPAALSSADVDRLAAQSEAEVTAARTGTKKKAHTLPKEVSDAQVDAVAAAHEKSVPANYQGVKLRTDATGKKTISGTFNPSRPFDAFLLKLADISQKHVGILQDLQSKLGTTVTVNYGHAPAEEGEVTSGARKAAQAASSAQDRASGEASAQNEDKNFIPLEVRFNKGKDSPSITVLGASPEKLLNNFNLTAAAVNELGGEVPYRDIHDPHLVADMKQLAQNHANGYRYDGHPIQSFPDQPVTQTPGFKPNVIPVERFEFLNLMLGDESAKTGKKGVSPEQTLKQGLAVKNQIPMTEAGETNMLRESINRAKGPVGDTTWSKATIENPLSEALRVDLINEVKPEVSNEDASIRPHGYAGDISRFFGEGSPNRTFTAAGFMPETAGAEGRGKAVEERAAKLWAEKGTESPFFKKWFGKSKVVDAGGKPLRVFKGMHPFDWTKETPTDKGPVINSINRTEPFPAFNHGEEGVPNIAGFFGDSETANRFAKGSTDGVIYPAFLKLENPYDIDAGGKNAADIQFGPTGKPFRDAMRSGKFDGAIIRNTKDEGTIYVASKPEQIKSATGNQGTFDAKNADMRFLPDTGTPKTAQEKARERIAAREASDPAKGERLLKDYFHGTTEEIGDHLSVGAGNNKSRFLHEEGIWFAPNRGKDFDSSWPSDATRYTGDHGTIIKANLDIKNPYYGDVHDIIGDKISAQWLKDHGYDAFVDDVSGSGMVVVLDPSQITEKGRERIGQQSPQEAAKARLAGGKPATGQFMPSDDTPTPEEAPEPSGRGPSGSPLNPPSSDSASSKDTGKPEDGETPGERLMREAEQAGLQPSLETMKAILRGDQTAFEKLRAMIKDRTGKEARFMPNEKPQSPQQRAQQRLQQKAVPQDDRKRQNAKEAARARIAAAA